MVKLTSELSDDDILEYKNYNIFLHPCLAVKYRYYLDLVGLEKQIQGDFNSHKTLFVT